MRFRVEYGFRRDSGMNYSVPTDQGNVVVEAPTREESRLVAIDEVYASAEKAGEIISHVTPTSTTALET